LGIQPTGHE